MEQILTWEFLYLIIALLFLAYQIFAFLTVILDSRDIHSKLFWLLVFIFIPVFGFILYFLFGRNTLDAGSKDGMDFHSRAERTLKRSSDYDWEKSTQNIIDGSKSVDTKKLIHLIANNSKSYVSLDNEVKILQDGAEKFDALKEDLKKAQKYIHMEYFIWFEDPLTIEIKEILIEKAKAGVEVRILVDHGGSLFTRYGYFKEMMKEGIKFTFSYEFTDIFQLKNANYRDHRKIVIIDGNIGYVGGINMAEEYITGGKKHPFWRDTHLRIIGSQVQYLQVVFAKSWEKIYGETLDHAKYIVSPTFENKSKKVAVQIASSGPSTSWNAVEQMCFQMITDANKTIRIQSPYFVPTEGLLIALKTAALAGIDVKVIMTGHPDKKFVFWAAKKYIREVLQSGVKFYFYEKGFMHAKTFAVDTKYCTIGTTNMDVRSFRLNYEINAVIYDKDVTKELEDDFDNDLKECRELTLNEFYQVNIFAKFRNEICSLLTPLL